MKVPESKLILTGEPKEKGVDNLTPTTVKAQLLKYTGPEMELYGNN